MIKRILKKFSAPTYQFELKGEEFEVNNWDISSFIVKKIIPIVGTHPFPLNELLLMISSVAWAKPTHIFEWGTHIGKSARIFYETSKFLNFDAEIHSVDLPDQVDHVEHPRNKRGKLVKGKPNVFLHQGDGVDKSIEIFSKLQKDAIPLFYVDGDHSYESVTRELTSILNIVDRVNIILHDTFFQTKESGYNIGPNKAIDEALVNFASKNIKRIDTKTGLPGMTFLYNKNK